MQANPNFLYLKKKVPNHRVTLLQGGTRSGKTYSLIYYLIWLCKTNPNARLEIDLCRDTYAALKATAWKDFKDVLIKHQLYRDEFHNKTDHIYNLYGNNINYYGADNPDKIHGRSRDILWINEAHQFPEETIDQLFPRTRHRIIADYNPALPQEHWLDKYIEKYPPLITTYKDNPHLTKAQVDDIESKLTNEYWWKVYGTGNRAQPTGAIFSNYVSLPFKDEDFEKDGKYIAEHMGFGQDYGFSTDPSTLIKIWIDTKGKKIYMKECFWSTGLSTGELYDKNLAHAGRNLIVGDSQEVRLIFELKQRGLNIVPAEKGTGSVTAGISLMLEYQLIIEQESKNLLKEFNNYSWVDKTNKSIPEDKWNHGIDAARYYISKTLANPNKGRYFLK
jgi:phage terminase large subunit